MRFQDFIGRLGLGLALLLFFGCHSENAGDLSADYLRADDLSAGDLSADDLSADDRKAGSLRFIPPCGRNAGSLLLYPEFNNHMGPATVLTITNVSTTTEVDVEFVYIDGSDCSEFNREETLTANDALSVVVSRSQARWELVVAGDWIQAYDFMPPPVRKNVKLGMYLSGKEHHEYTNPSVPKLIGSEDNVAYLELSVLWEVQLVTCALPLPEKPDDRKVELTMIETWEWFEGEWYLRGSQRPKEFLEEHPDVRNK